MWTPSTEADSINDNSNYNNYSNLTPIDGNNNDAAMWRTLTSADSNNNNNTTQTGSGNHINSNHKISRQ